MALLDKRNARHCDHCGTPVEQSKAIHKHLGQLVIEADMQFCGEQCQEAMIGRMMQSPAASSHMRHNLLVEAPLIGEQLAIECDLESCPKHRRSAAAAAVAPPAPPPELLELAEAQEPVEAPRFVENLKEKLLPGCDAFAVDTNHASQDLVRRVVDYATTLGSDPTAEAIKVMEAVRKGIEPGLQVQALKRFIIITESALGELEESRDFFPKLDQAALNKVTKKRSVATDKMAKHILRLVKSSTRNGSHGVNVARLSVDIRLVFEKVVNLTGEHGLTFLKSFFSDNVFQQSTGFGSGDFSK